MMAILFPSVQAYTRCSTQSAVVLFEPLTCQVFKFRVDHLGDQSQVQQDLVGRAGHPAGATLQGPGSP